MLPVDTTLVTVLLLPTKIVSANKEITYFVGKGVIRVYITQQNTSGFGTCSKLIDAICVIKYRSRKHYNLNGTLGGSVVAPSS